MSPQLYMSMHGLNNLFNNNVQLQRHWRHQRQWQQQQQQWLHIIIPYFIVY